MGMCSTFIDQNIEITNQKAIDALKHLIKDEESVLTGEGEIDFSKWSGYKIYGYFYPTTKAMLNLLAPHIKGFAEFEYEEGFRFRLVFKDGKVFLQTEERKIDWKSFPLEELK